MKPLTWYNSWFGTRNPPRKPVVDSIERFTADVREASGPLLVVWLKDVPFADKVRGAEIIQAELARRDELPLLEEDDLSCFDTDQRTIQFLADQHDAAEPLTDEGPYGLG